MIKMVVDVASNHNIKNHNISLGNSIEYLAGNTGLATSSIGPHQLDAKGNAGVEVQM